MAHTFPPRPEHSEVAQADMTPTAQVPADQHPASPSIPPRNNSMPPTPAIASRLHPRRAPRTVRAFPLAKVHRQVNAAPSEPRMAKSAGQADAHPRQSPRHDPPPPLPAQTSQPSTRAVLTALRPFPLAPQSFPSVAQEAASQTSALRSQNSAAYTPAARQDLMHQAAAPIAPLTVSTPPCSTDTSPQAQRALSPAPADTAAAKCKALWQKIAALKASLKTFITGQETVRADMAAVLLPGARQKKAPCCKFCGRAGHVIKACEEAEEYIHLGKCKCNPSGTIVLPSGAEIPRAIDCKTLQEHADKYHQWKCSSQAAAAKWPQDNKVTKQQTSVPPRAVQAAPSATPPTPPTPEASHPTASKVAAPPQSPGLQGAPQVYQLMHICAEVIPTPAAQPRMH